MKKLFITLLLMTAAMVSTNAEITTIWTGPYNTESWNGVNLPAETFAGLDYGDKVVFSVTRDVEGATAANELWYQLQVQSWDNDVATNITGGDNAVTDIQEDGDVTVELTDAQVDAIKTHGFSVNGHYVVVNSISVGTGEAGGDTPDQPVEPAEGTTTELFSGSIATGDDWSGYVDLSYDNRGALANAKIGDVITVTYTAAESGYPQVQIVNPEDWDPYDENAKGEVAAASGEHTFTYEIADAAILQDIQNNGLIVRGGDITITKVELTTYPDSYDAVAVTVGEAGVATYSKSGKAIDFTSTALKAYYASAVETGKVTLTPISQVPEYTGIIVKGEPGIYEIPVIAAIDGLATNYLKAVGDWNTTINSAEGDYCYVSVEDAAEISFSLVSVDTEVSANKAYLETSTDITPAEGAIELVYSDETSTGISDIKVSKAENNAYYNLQGMRVEYPSKGIYIHNGKKIIIR